MSLFRRKPRPDQMPQQGAGYTTQQRYAEHVTRRETARRNIRRFTAVFIALFAVMTVYFVYGAISHEAEYFNNDFNRRDELLLKKDLRGSIYAGDGETVLAYSEAFINGDGEVDQERVYPFGPVFAHAVGYSEMGGSALEKYAKYDLLHSDLPLSRKVEYDRAYSIEERLYPGNQVVTTLDPALQMAAYNAMDGYEGAVLVTEVSTGRILAMVSKPDFDPGQIEELWDSLIADTESGTLLNRATQGMYPPGSTFKIVDCIELLTEDPGAMESYRYDCSGIFEYEEKSIHCYEYERHGSLGLRESFAHSCNSSFANIGVNYLDQRKYAGTLKKLFFDRELPYDLPSAVSTAGDVENMPKEDVMQLSIGQGATSMSPLHVHMITSAVAADGTLYKPQLIKEVRDADGKQLRSYSAEKADILMSAEVAENVTQLMRLAVEGGTAIGLSDRSYEPCGKTGSAEFDTESRSSHAWFTGFAPASDPEICITVLIEGKGMASSYAVPVAGKIMDVWFEE